MFVTNPIGIIGESTASEMLEKKGFKVIEHNWRMGHLEVDLIAENKTHIVFAEVKARTSTYGDIRPEKYVDEGKKKRMVAAANAYLKYKHIEKIPRFDIFGILVDAQTGQVTHSNHMEGAFVPSGKTICSTSLNGSWKWKHKSRSFRK